MATTLVRRDATSSLSGEVLKNKIYLQKASAFYNATNNGQTVLSMLIPKGTYRFVLSGFMNFAASSNCAASMLKDGILFHPLGVVTYANRAHLNASSQGSQTLEFFYTVDADSTFAIQLSINSTSEIGSLMWYAETLSLYDTVTA